MLDKKAHPKCVCVGGVLLGITGQVSAIMFSSVTKYSCIPRYKTGKRTPDSDVVTKFMFTILKYRILNTPSTDQIETRYLTPVSFVITQILNLLLFLFLETAYFTSKQNRETDVKI